MAKIKSLIITVLAFIFIIPVVVFAVAPNVPAPVLNSTAGTNISTQDLACFVTAEDNDTNTNHTNVTVIWYKDLVQQFNITYTNGTTGYTNGTLVNSTLNTANTSVGEIWKCGVQVHNNESSAWVNSSNLTILNSPPNTPTPTLNTTDGTNQSDQDLNCFDTLIDYDNETMNVTVIWHNSTGHAALTIEYNNSYVNGTAFNAVLNRANTSDGDSWNCSLKIWDNNTEPTSWVNSSGVTIVNSPPATPTPSLSTTSNTNYLTQDLDCTSMLVDADNEGMNVTVVWYGTPATITIEYNNSYANGTLFNATLNSANTSAKDIWICSIGIWDNNTESDGWTNSSTLHVVNLPNTPSVGRVGHSTSISVPVAEQLALEQGNNIEMEFSSGQEIDVDVELLISDSGAKQTESHKISVTEIITDQKVKVEISSTPQTFWLAEGEEKIVDLNNNGVDDLKITAQEITTTAKIIIQLLSQEIAIEPTAPAAVAEVTELAAKDPISEFLENQTYILAIILVTAAIVVGFSYKMYVKKSHRKIKTRKKK